MKKVLVTLTVVAVLAIGAGTYAFGPGWFGGGHMMGGYGMDPGLMGYNDPNGGFGYNQKFPDETRDLRKALDEKRFEYYEALRNPETAPESIAKLEKEITELQQKIYEKAPANAYRGGSGRTGTPCWQ